LDRKNLVAQADQRMKAEMNRLSHSAFTQDGRLRDEGQRSQVSLGEYLDLGGIPWAPDPYGADHCQNLSRLVDYMTELPETWGGVVGGPLNLHDRKVMHVVSMLYCTGRTQGEHNYSQRSAAFADQYLRAGAGANTYWGKESVREEVCRLIYKHNDPEMIRTDKRLQIFADACRYDLARIAPNTLEGQLLLEEHIKPDLFYTGWAKSKDNFRAWMVTRNWK
jgi:hypothetical protein